MQRMGEPRIDCTQRKGRQTEDHGDLGAKYVADKRINNYFKFIL
jgi:hypothetical protein